MRSIRLATAIAALAACHAVAATEAVHFGYAGKVGPEHWAELSPAFGECAAGRNQSPIDLDGERLAALPEIEIDYPAREPMLLNNGHTVQASYGVAKGKPAAGSSEAGFAWVPPGGHAKSGNPHHGDRFELVQFHFHAPSEHRLDGHNAAAEIHLVHRDAAGNLAVLGVLVEEGAPHAGIAKLWRELPDEDGESLAPGQKLSAAELLPKDHSYRYYSGSLTTPPCSEGVRWIVFDHPITMSADQLGALRDAIGFANNRPVQPHNARIVLVHATDQD